MFKLTRELFLSYHHSTLFMPLFPSYNYGTSNAIHRPVFDLKHDVSETGFCPRIQVGPTKLDEINITSLWLRGQ
jgi:hypothetical protein